MNRRSRILLVTFAVLMAAVLLVSFWPRGKAVADLRVPGWAPGSKSDKGDEEAPYDSIEIVLEGQNVALSRGPDRAWTLGAPAGARPDKYRVRQIVDLLREDLTSVLPASVRKEDLKSFGLDAGGRALVVYRGAGGAKTELEIGLWQKPEGATGEGDTFVRVAGDERVWRVLGRNLRKPFDGGVKGLRDRKLFRFEASDVVAVRIRDAAALDVPDRVIHLVSSEAATQVQKDGEAKKKPDRTWKFENLAGITAGEVKAYLTAIAGIYVQEYADALPSGVTIPDDAFSVRLELADGGVVGLRVASGKDDTAWMQVDGTAGFCKVAKYVLEQIHKHIGDLRDRRLVAVARDAIRAVDLVDGDRRLSFERSGNVFRSVVPSGINLSKTLVDTFLTDIENLRADAFLPPSALAGVQTGLDKPILTIAVTTTDGGRRVLKVGADKGSGARYVSIAGSSDVATLPAWALTRIRKSPDDLVEKKK